MSMNNKNTRLIRKITTEYVNFIKRTNTLIRETKRATGLALKEVLKLQDGDSILIKEDGSLEIMSAEADKGEYMTESEKECSEKLTLNGKDVTAEELERQREAAKNEKGARLEEISKGNFRLRLND